MNKFGIESTEGQIKDKQPSREERLEPTYFFPKLFDAQQRIEEALRTQSSILDLSGLGLTELPKQVVELQKVRVLNLSDNQLSSLPEFINELTQLQSLNLSRNRLARLPASISQLAKLARLDLMNNQLEQLPETIGQLQELHSLLLKNNRLTTLPQSIGQLQKLQRLDLGSNNLMELPESLRHLPFLQSLNLRGNSSLGILQEVLEEDDTQFEIPDPSAPRKILDYYFHTIQDSHPLNEAKLILVGRGGAGKTSIVNRLIRNRFVEGLNKTHGIEISEWPIKLHGVEDVMLRVWDFGGQEILHATHRFFMTRRSLYVLVLNGREGEDTDAEYWLKLIQSFGGESPIVVVLNKVKEHPFDLNRRALQEKYPAIRGFIKTDCEDGTGIADLRAMIEQETDQLEHLRDLFPRKWFQIKNHLASSQKNYLNFEQYRELCNANQESDHQRQDDLAAYLHDLGIVLNFKDNFRLQDKHVLNPHWVTWGIYGILSSSLLAERNGRIGLGDLPRILDPREYPREVHSFFFDLMMKFELCFRFDDDAQYLIPDLLDKEEPKVTEEFVPVDCLNVEFHYSVLPEGLLPRFIVRTAWLSEGLSRWRTGVILKYEGCQALVKGDSHEKKVFIRVKGPADGRHFFLAFIRQNFDRIHRDISRLEVREMLAIDQHPTLLMGLPEMLVLEKNGVPVVPKVADSPTDNTIIQVKISEELNRLYPDGKRPPLSGGPPDGGLPSGGERRSEPTKPPVRVFISYSHSDAKDFNDLKLHLASLVQIGRIEIWHDQMIPPGVQWDELISEKLEHAEIILFLVSANFVASRYCSGKEVITAMTRYKNGEACVIPVLIRYCHWTYTLFGELQPLPSSFTPVENWKPKSKAWKEITEGVDRMARMIRGIP